MGVVAPAKPRAAILDTPQGLEIVIPSKRNWFPMLFLSAWLCGWFFGEVSVWTELLGGGERSKGGPQLFLIVWLTLWTVGGAMAFLLVLWQIAGAERVVLGPSVLTIKREIFGAGPSQGYEIATIRNLRVAAQSYNPFDARASLQFWGIGGGVIGFDHGAATIRFGASIQEAEAASIVQRIQSSRAIAS